MENGKNICKELKKVRQHIAKENNIPLEMEECTYKGECRGTCPRCEAEVRYLENALAERLKLGKVATIAGLALGLAVPGTAVAQDTTQVNVSKEKPIVIEIQPGMGGIISEDIKKLEKVAVDTLPTVLPIHKTASVTATGKIKGTIKDEDRHPLPYVNVLLYKKESEDPLAVTMTDTAGSYLFQNLEPGIDYSLKYSFDGYQTYQKNGLRVRPTGFTVVDIQMRFLDAPPLEPKILGMMERELMIEIGDPNGATQQMEREGVKVIVRD